MDRINTAVTLLGMQAEPDMQKTHKVCSKAYTKRWLQVNLRIAVWSLVKAFVILHV